MNVVWFSHLVEGDDLAVHQETGLGLSVVDKSSVRPVQPATDVAGASRGARRATIDFQESFRVLRHGARAVWHLAVHNPPVVGVEQFVAQSNTQ